MSTTGTDEMGPVKVGAPYIDYATGLNAAFAVMAGLRQRDLTGEFQLVDVSMLDTAMTMMANNLVTVATTGEKIFPSWAMRRPAVRRPPGVLRPRR